MRVALRASLLALPLAATLSLVFAQPLAAQQRDTQRTVQGVVTDKADVPLKGAIVHLKDLRALSQRSFITPQDGAYRFGQLGATSDYEIWADFNGKKSTVRSITSFDTKTLFTINLKIDK